MRKARLLVVLLAVVMIAGAAPAVAGERGGGYATGVFTITSWNETVERELPDGARLIHLTAGDTFTGDITGTACAEEEHLIRTDETRAFAGMIVVTGRIGRRDGSFVLRTTGTFDGTTARSEWMVVPGSGTGGLAGLRGVGTDRVSTTDGWTVRYTLTYWFDR